MDPFWLIYERYKGDVYRFALFLTGEPAAADDLVSETFVRAWTARDRIQQETVKGDVQVEHRSSLHDVRARLRCVAKGDRRALLLYVFKEMTYAQVAATLGISLAATKSRICRAREALSAPLSHVVNEERG